MPTPIEWTDETWNVINGCRVVSPGCTHCYAMRLAGTRFRNHPSRTGLTIDSKAGPVWNGEVRLIEHLVDQPLRWTRPRRIFVCAHGDLFFEGVPSSWVERIFGVAIAAHHLRGHTFQILTKRSERMREMLNHPAFWDAVNTYAADEVMSRVDPLDRRSDDARATLNDYGPDNPAPGLWLGVSVEDQTRADQRIPDLLATPAAVRWISAEPLLGEVDLDKAWHGESAVESECWGECAWCTKGNPPMHNCQKGRQSEADFMKGRSGIDWVVVGGESGPGARPMHPAWARQLRDQSAAAGVPFLFKQWGDWTPAPSHLPLIESAGGSAGVTPDVAWPDGQIAWGTADQHGGEGRSLQKIGKRLAGRMLDGVQHDGFPA